MDVIVVKVGGSAGVDLDAFCADAARLHGDGMRLVIVHGGSHATDTLSSQLGHPPQTLVSPSGMTSRRTDRRTLEIFQMACRGVMNQAIVERLQRRGVNAVGLSGLDGRLWQGARKSAVRAVVDGRVTVIRDDYTGTVDRVNVQLLRMLLESNLVPVISPPALSDDNEAINVDADRAAARTAAAVRASQLLLLSNVKGLLRSFPDESSLIERVERSGVPGYIEIAGGRMKKKVLGASEALEGGVARVVIGDARRAEPIASALAGAGTVFE